MKAALCTTEIETTGKNCISSSLWHFFFIPPTSTLSPTNSSRPYPQKALWWLEPLDVSVGCQMCNGSSSMGLFTWAGRCSSSYSSLQFRNCSDSRSCSKQGLWSLGCRHHSIIAQKGVEVVIQFGVVTTAKTLNWQWIERWEEKVVSMFEQKLCT
jgi:hypothetical protein